MKEKIIAILSDLRPEFDFTDESLNFIEEGMLDSFDVVSSTENAEVPVRSFLNFTPSRLYICTLPLGEVPVTATVM